MWNLVHLFSKSKNSAYSLFKKKPRPFVQLLLILLWQYIIELFLKNKQILLAKDRIVYMHVVQAFQHKEKRQEIEVTHPNITPI